jgi:hypothetical protein
MYDAIFLIDLFLLFYYELTACTLMNELVKVSKHADSQIDRQAFQML